VQKIEPVANYMIFLCAQLAVITSAGVHMHLKLSQTMFWDLLVSNGRMESSLEQLWEQYKQQ
jgi:hypothetical protein